MAPVISAFFAASILAAHTTAQAVNAQIFGTWSTKSKKVLTGSGFYDPTSDTFTEPALTGISYSFTLDGHYEEAYYRAIPNPTSPNCAQGLIQWQHGTFVQSADTSMVLTPIAIDGRQLVSNPCSPSKTSTLLKYNQPETFSLVNFTIDAYNQQPRLDIEGFDGTPMNPMWQVATTPMMLPTTTLTPTSTSGVPRATGGSKIKRALQWEGQSNVKRAMNPKAAGGLLSADRWFWLGIGMTGVGSILIFCC